MISPPPGVAASYELRVQGHLASYWATCFDGFTITHQDDGTTALRGSVRDQSELHGLLAKVRDLGTPLVSVTPLVVTGSDDAAIGSSHSSCTHDCSRH